MMTSQDPEWSIDNPLGEAGQRRVVGPLKDAAAHPAGVFDATRVFKAFELECHHVPTAVRARHRTSKGRADVRPGVGASSWHMIPVWGTSTGAAHRMLIVAFGSTVKAPSTHHGLSSHLRNQANQDFTWALPGTARLESRSGIFTVEGRHLAGELREWDPQMCGWVGGVGWPNLGQPPSFETQVRCPNNASKEPHVPISYYPAPNLRLVRGIGSIALLGNRANFRDPAHKPGMQAPQANPLILTGR